MGVVFWIFVVGWGVMFEVRCIFFILVFLFRFFEVLIFVVEGFMLDIVVIWNLIILVLLLLVFELCCLNVEWLFVMYEKCFIFVVLVLIFLEIVEVIRCGFILDMVLFDLVVKNFVIDIVGLVKSLEVDFIGVVLMVVLDIGKVFEVGVGKDNIYCILFI